jgi:hypothetical protein
MILTLVQLDLQTLGHEIGGKNEEEEIERIRPAFPVCLVCTNSIYSILQQLPEQVRASKKLSHVMICLFLPRPLVSERTVHPRPPTFPSWLECEHRNICQFSAHSSKNY